MQRIALLVVTVTLAALSVTAVAAGPTPPRPVSGTWVLDSLFGMTKGGGFKLSRSGVSGLHTTVGSANSPCGTGSVAVRGRQSLSIATRGGYAVWIAGHNAPKSSDGATADRATVVQQGKAVKGGVKIFFQKRRSAEGEIDYGSCKLEFNAHKKR